MCPGEEKLDQFNPPSRVTIYTNASCICCDGVKKHMVHVGALIMCFECYRREFGDNLEPVGSDIYRKWLAIWKQKA